MPKLIDLTGKIFGRLTVIDRAETKSNRTIWNCKCECGKNTKPAGYDLRSGKTISCGCYHKEDVKYRSSSGLIGWKIKNDYRKKHGLTHHKLYYIYRGMHDRCYRKKCKDFKFYGEKGIIICDEWKNDFLKFYEWSLQNGWREGLTIDRIKNSGNYEPLNCQWITQSQNSKKRSSSS